MFGLSDMVTVSGFLAFGIWGAAHFFEALRNYQASKVTGNFVKTLNAKWDQLTPGEKAIVAFWGQQIESQNQPQPMQLMNAAQDTNQYRREPEEEESGGYA